MIADCSSLDQMFSHYVPQLFASVGSTLVIGVCMFACDWRMALAVLWVVPVAVALTAGSKKIQDAFGTKNILNKRAVADCIQDVYKRQPLSWCWTRPPPSPTRRTSIRSKRPLRR